MKVYVVGKLNVLDISKLGDWELINNHSRMWGWELIGIFSSYEKAKEFAKQFDDVLLFISPPIEIDNPLPVYEEIKDGEYLNWDSFFKKFKRVYLLE